MFTKLFKDFLKIKKWWLEPKSGLTGVTHQTNNLKPSIKQDNPLYLPSHRRI